ncbi:hypothetical protein BaRGS_00001992 [Batillaria attramentaria]|uniref:Uncharacterized protein n=1 Tax=Batillaria attramentaria TaxID=370345 RepID=A0ABD0M5F2_9CAEN
MYALPRGPSKIAASTRRGPPRQLETNENRDRSAEKSDPGVAMSTPRPVFNGKRLPARPNNIQQSQHTDRPRPNPQHEEFVRYLSESWSKVQRDYEAGKEGGPEIYREKNPNPHLANFKPFDLPEYWGRKQLDQLKI